MSTAPTFRDLVATQLTARARSRWHCISDMQSIAPITASHAYVLLAAASGHALDQQMPIVELASEESIQIAERMTPEDLGGAVRSAMACLESLHAQLLELDQLVNEYAEATGALLALKADEPRSIKTASILALQHRMQQAARRRVHRYLRRGPAAAER